MITLMVTFLFYILLAGQATVPYLTYPVYALWLALAAWTAIKRPRLVLPLLVIVAAGLALGVTNDIWGWRRFATVAGYSTTYQFLKIQRVNFKPALAQSAIILSALVIVGALLGNANIVSAFIYLSAPFALDAYTDWRRRWLTLGLGVIALLMTGCRGAWLAAGVAGIVYSQRWLALSVAPIAVAALAWLRPETNVIRLQTWLHALSDISLWGHGFGAAIYPNLEGSGSFFFAHCLPLTVAVEAGVPGLAALAWGLWRVIPRLLRGWRGAVLAGLLAWLLVDEVIWFWGPGMIAVYLLSEVMS